MAPRLGKTERLHMMMSPDELAAIDEWSFKNKVRGRSEAVRALCKLALGAGSDVVEAEIETAQVSTVADALGRATLSVPEAGAIFFGLSRNGSYEAAKRGDLPTLKLGRSIVVPVAPIAEQCGLHHHAGGESARLGLQDRLARCLKACVDAPLVTVRDSDSGRPLDLRLGSFNRELAQTAEALVTEAAQ
ncbi:hypothetical protein [Mesorhizobium sp. B2-4-6]|uniref:hypothetical protein n=1 Tax=Mesorhizobium sp. B2-4-6 TaxID=2589943 RepID=UPI0015E40DBC|nr:hypothetical protein [Mesorhizobium sp. B2-4-6]